ncbi:sigma-24 (FecI-like) [Anaeromyxobacter dehalogenans 2CP-C]|uniref:Sigma-24 (FecI-like) n=1 Tax=Anaeromyxobacter dehalogenans (strain 2CP-C) TaxID=290397 RepID=Q2IFZ6_ANADE|nr:sigma-24 (FecI-like) [Anaeromyxobacter dehalogenans 2CP-C]
MSPALVFARCAARWSKGDPIARLAERLALAAPVTSQAEIEADVLDLADAADHDAVERTLAGDTDAFASVVRRYAGGLVGTCSRMVGDARLGEELAQEALARAYTRLASFRGDCRFRHWLYRIAVNGCRDWLKAGARAERASDLSGDELVSAVDPERDAAARQAVLALQSALAALPAKYREAFTLFHVENLPYEEIEAATGVRVNALKVRVHRARIMLRERLGDLLDPDEVLP